MLMMMLRIISLSVLARAWGPDGHSIVAYIAQKLLSADGRHYVSSLLENKSMADVANWADEVRNTQSFEWSGPLHFADLPDRNCTFIESRDCPAGFCVSGAIANYSRRLSDSSNLLSHQEDIKFLIHFLGDAHQPLHAGFKSDRGGNSIKVDSCFEDIRVCHKDNLHSVWDSVILKEGEKLLDVSVSDRWIGLADKLTGKVGGAKLQPKVDSWRSACSASFEACARHIVTESARYACDFAYINADGEWIRSDDHLNKDYYDTRIELIEDRLIAAGVRLSSLIDLIIRTKSDTSSEGFIIEKRNF